MGTPHGDNYADWKALDETRAADRAKAAERLTLMATRYRLKSGVLGQMSADALVVLHELAERRAA